jgi:spore coat protein CotF
MVQNPKVEVSSGPDLNDKDILNDILITEKNMSNNYSIALNEMSNDYLYKDLLTIFEETQNTQRRLFNLLFKKGWYTLEKADTNKMSQKHQEYSGMLSEMQQGG